MTHHKGVITVYYMEPAVTRLYGPCPPVSRVSTRQPSDSFNRTTLSVHEDMTNVHVSFHETVMTVLCRPYSHLIKPSVSGRILSKVEKPDGWL